MLVEFLFHEVAEAAFADGGAGHAGPLDLALHDGGVGVEETRAVAVNHRPIAVIQIGDALGERSESDAVGGDKHLVLAEADGERRPVLGATMRSGWPEKIMASA